MVAETTAAGVKKGALTRELAEFCAGLEFGDLPAAVKDHAKMLILDGLGCCLQGATLPWTQIVADLVRDEGGAQEATLIGMPGRFPATSAVLVNSTAGHGFEMDDIHRDAIIHPNSLTVPAALAVAERNGGASGANFIAAVVATFATSFDIGTISRSVLKATRRGIVVFSNLSKNLVLVSKEKGSSGWWPAPASSLSLIHI